MCGMNPSCAQATRYDGRYLVLVRHDDSFYDRYGGAAAIPGNVILFAKAEIIAALPPVD